MSSPHPVDVRRVDPRALGFRIDAFLDLQHWTPLPIDDTVPMATFPDCPADLTHLRTLCTIVDGTGRRRIRVGCCPACGHVTYIDRPAKTWIDDYYLRVWDAHELDSRVDRREARLKAVLPSPNTGVTIAVGLDVDRSRPVCEIGCGYGANLKHMADAGFTSLIGIDASQHRVDLVQRLFGIEALASPFESAAAQARLRQLAPFSIIYSHHAFEHTYHPDALFAAASGLQQPGDYLIISVPRQQLEPSMSVLFFVPHLHSFTRTSLERMAARFGYALFDDSRTHPKNLNLAFQKRVEPVPPPAPESAAPFEDAVRKFVDGLQLGRRFRLPRRLWWHTRSTDRAGHAWMVGPESFQARRWERELARSGVEKPRTARIRGLRRRVTRVEESPLEIQFREGLALLFK